MRMEGDKLRLYLVTDRAHLNGRKLEEQVEEAIQAGVSFVQLREKELEFADFLKRAKSLKALTGRYRVPFVINDNVEVALSVGADGVHIGQGDEDAGAVRARIGGEGILGVSVQTVEQALAAERKGADYLGVGAMFPTRTKGDAADVPMEVLHSICQAVHIPVVAIGGIHEGNVMRLKGSGVAGIAVVSAILASKDVTAATEGLLSLVKDLS